MRTLSIPVGKVFGVDLRIHAAFLLLFPVFATAESADAAAASRILGMVLIVFLSALFHELAVVFAAAQAGAPVKALILLPTGGVIVLAEAASVTGLVAGMAEWKREMRMALAGPLASLFFAAVAAASIAITLPEANLWAHPYIHSSNLPRSLVWINLGLAALNLLPAYPLDGGRFLRAFFARNHSMVQATRRAVSIAHTQALLLMVLAMLLYVYDRHQASIALSMLGLMLFLGAQLEERSVFFQSVLESVRLEEIMLTDFATLSPADTLEDALEKAVHTLQDDFPVIRGGDLVGIISRQVIVESLRSQGNGYVQAVMNKLVEASQKTESLAGAFRKLSARNLTLIPVVEEQRLIGIVTLQNLTHSIGLLAESRKLRAEAEDEDE